MGAVFRNRDEAARFVKTIDPQASTETCVQFAALALPDAPYVDKTPIPVGIVTLPQAPRQDWPVPLPPENAMMIVGYRPTNSPSLSALSGGAAWGTAISA